MAHCPFCGAAETDRLDLEGHRFLVFACMFSPEVDPALDEAALERHLREAYAGRGAQYFRATCDALHLVVTRGGAERGAEPPGPSA